MVTGSGAKMLRWREENGVGVACAERPQRPAPSEPSGNFRDPP